MDLAHFLNQRLDFVEYFHARTTELFQEVKRKIEAEEPPYVDTRHPDDPDDTPAFLEEWEKADAAMNFTGAACLDMLQSTFHAFLDEYMKQIGNSRVIPQLKKMDQKSWFGNYRAFFHSYLQIDWASSEADLDLVEQIILARNDFTHNIDLLSLNIFQTPFHCERYPNSAFADPRWKTVFVERTRLIVPGETLQRAIASLRTLCEYLDGQRYVLLKRWRTERKANETEK